MRTPRKVMLATVLVALAWAGSTVPAQDPNQPAYDDGYADGDAGRFRYVENGASILRADETAGSPPGVATNAPVFAGDTVRTGGDQRVEIQIANGTIVRLDRNTVLDFQALPRPYAEFRDNVVLALDLGTIQVSAVVGDDEEIRIDTPQASVYLLEDGEFRIETDERDRTRVLVRRGVAEVVGAGGSVLVRGGMRTNVYAGIIPEDPRAYSAYASDPFDQWVAAREDAYRPREVRAGDDDAYPADVPIEVSPYVSELSTYGRWVSVPTYGWVWYPYDVGPGWRPYWDGYWHYGSGGYFWVSREPWGWAPYHFGRWSWVSGFGWCWIPGRVFGGAWVSWSWGSAYIGWAPLDYWGYPVLAGPSYLYGYYDPHCWTFVHVSQVVVSDVRRHAVPVNRVGAELERHAVSVRAPRVAPSRLAASPEWRERAARSAAEDRTGRIAPIGRERNRDRALPDVERSIRSRAPERTERSGAPAARPIDPAGRRVERSSERPRSPVERRERAIAPPQDRAPIERARPDAAGRREAPVESNERGFSRRILTDPRVLDGNRSEAGGSNRNPRPGRGEARRVDVPAPREDADRAVGPRRGGVRDLYDRLSQPRRTVEPRRSDAPAAEGRRAPRGPDSPGAVRSSPSRPTGAAPRTDAAPRTPRAPRPEAAPRTPRAEPPRAGPAPRAPRQAPRAAPPAAPKRDGKKNEAKRGHR